MSEWLVKNWRFVILFLAVKFFFIAYIIMAGTAHANATYIQLFPTINVDGTVTNWNSTENYYGMAGVRIYFLGNSSTFTGNETIISNFNSSSGVSLSWIIAHQPAVNGGWVMAGDMSSVATTTGYYAMAYGIGGDYAPDWNGIVPYYVAYITGGTQYSGVPVENYNCDDPTTRILNFTPENGTTTGNNVDFSLYACVNEADIGLVSGIDIRLHNIDQNWILVGDLLSPNDIYLVSEREVPAGLFSFATTTNIADGNYRLEACIDKAYFWGWIRNPFADITECQSHQFIVNQGSFIGNISQNAWGETNDFFNSLSATSSEALLERCNPLGGFLSGTSTFDIRMCMAGLLKPDANEMKQTLEDLRQTVLQRFPFGYVTRFISIVTNPATTTLPTWTATIQIGAGNDLTPETTSITIDPSDMLAGGASTLSSIQDPINGKTARDIFYPIIQLTIALSVIMIIVKDLTKLTHKDGDSRDTKLS